MTDRVVTDGISTENAAKSSRLSFLICGLVGLLSAFDCFREYYAYERIGIKCTQKNRGIVM